MKPLSAALIAVAVGVAVGAAARWLVVVPPFWAIVVALPFAACTFLATHLVGAAAPLWHPVPRPDESLTTHQASALSSRLAEAARDQNRFQRRIQPRLCELALNTLRRRPGLHDLADLQDDRARRELGAELHTLLTTTDATLPSPRRLTELLSRLENG
ncbi:hypothetical protein [Actinocrispum sp. NPDC049592]|uniref:hypothetical protein n=1 Tax=Actinocrispum sp. NPDC049592 TaxID=3154835 RepID=UPI003413AEC5